MDRFNQSVNGPDLLCEVWVITLKHLCVLILCALGGAPGVGWWGAVAACVGGYIPLLLKSGASLSGPVIGVPSSVAATRKKAPSVIGIPSVCIMAVIYVIRGFPGVSSLQKAALPPVILMGPVPPVPALLGPVFIPVSLLIPGSFSVALLPFSPWVAAVRSAPHNLRIRSPSARFTSASLSEAPWVRARFWGPFRSPVSASPRLHSGPALGAISPLLPRHLRSAF
ncbi:uncharacterized protein LOC106512208 [Austrofundulus limnaeus]|uniref:Uncharacterized protein LOC106512208 n=1 Tax=Austrofundulus limnaeus TaxID=52670 RepID=A0A2I4ALG8_AUSLI|nr:PREDICTED: uncharacterized protein LOC106512208 [Austrofundulus limnaeus]